jgi:hypothetical protein
MRTKKFLKAEAAREIQVRQLRERVAQLEVNVGMEETELGWRAIVSKGQAKIVVLDKDNFTALTKALNLYEQRRATMYRDEILEELRGARRRLQ